MYHRGYYVYIYIYIHIVCTDHNWVNQPWLNIQRMIWLQLANKTRKRVHVNLSCKTSHKKQSCWVYRSVDRLPTTLWASDYPTDKVPTSWGQCAVSHMQNHAKSCRIMQNRSFWSNLLQLLLVDSRSLAFRLTGDRCPWVPAALCASGRQDLGGQLGERSMRIPGNFYRFW